jgi:hypothetical protein
LRSEEYITAAGGQAPIISSAAAGKQGDGRDRRAADRYDLNDAPGSLIHKGKKTACQMVDISLTGCCVRTTLPFTAGSLETVKVTFPIFEMILSIWGATQWVRGGNLLGIQFRHPTARSKNQLAGLLTCLIDKSAAEVVKRAMAEIVNDPSENPIIQLEHPPAPDSKPEPESEPEQEVTQAVMESPVPNLDPVTAPVRPALSGGEQVLIMEAGDSPARLTLPGDDSVLTGDVVDLSLTGCLMRLSRLRTVRLKAQAELTFHMQGLPFHLAGVTQQMHDKRTLEIRFTQMSRRSRDDLNQVIGELIERSKRGNGPS